MNVRQATRIHERYAELETGLWFLGLSVGATLLGVDPRWLMAVGLGLLILVRWVLTANGLLPPRPARSDHDRGVVPWRWVSLGLGLAVLVGVGTIGLSVVPFLLMVGGIYLAGLSFLGGGRWRLLAGNFLILGGLGLLFGLLPHHLATYGFLVGAGLAASGGLSLREFLRQGLSGGPGA
jgi:hypothetical protein